MDAIGRMVGEDGRTTTQGGTLASELGQAVHAAWIAQRLPDCGLRDEARERSAMHARNARAVVEG